MTKEEEIYLKGFRDGLKCYAWWKDGIEFVGMGRDELSHAQLVAKTLWNYKPPKENNNEKGI